MERVYASIDLKSFYASVECVQRGLDPLKTNLVVADESRTDKTICLAVSPALKSYGMGGRIRLFEVKQIVRDENYKRRIACKGHQFSGKSCNNDELNLDPNLELDFIIAKPRMSYYMEYSTKIYNIYLKYVSSEDIFAYSIDEVFCDITDYLTLYKTTAEEFVSKILQDVYNEMGIIATAGIGTNMYLAKIAMDIVAKHSEPDENGVRMAKLDEMSYRKLLWNHKPIKDFWRVGKGISEKLEKHGMYTMGDVARCSVKNEDLLYKLFGINAELLIDHAWGWECCTIKSAKNYKPVNNSISSGQVLHTPYSYEQAELIVKEMTDLLVLDLVEKRLVTDQIVLTIGYDAENLKNSSIGKGYKGDVTIDRYGRKIPKHAHGTINLPEKTSSTKDIIDATVKLYKKIANPKLLVRRINVTACKVVSEEDVKENKFEQIDLFTNYEEKEKEEELERSKKAKEKNLQNTLVTIKKKYGKNSVLKAMNLEEDGTTIERNKQVGGHRA